ncbi:MAG TPA: selenide, water dikinase SelD, partial [Anaerolineales bacterium]|nr:selenide, water dikinase SelD [Anaerolineales bacterium]
MLRPLQSLFEAAESPDLLVGLGAPDDAAVWRLDDSRALVVTTDFFTPIVDDPYAYGAIAAANALSDLYAMGAAPFLALNLVAMPTDLEPEIVAEILRGGAEQIRRAGAVLAGGHSIQDQEPKYGLVALGMADPAHLMTKDASRPGDRLVLTKPLGTGVTTTALIRDQGEPGHAAEAIEWMSRLNDRASRLALQAGVRAATDVTGFGLLGHGLELAQA